MNFCKRFGPRSGLTKPDARQNIEPDLNPICVFLKEFLEKVDFEKNQQATVKHEQLLREQKINLGKNF